MQAPEVDHAGADQRRHRRRHGHRVIGVEDARGEAEDHRVGQQPGPPEHVAGPRPDEFIGIDKPETQLRGHELSHRGLAGAHEADEGQIVDNATAGHGIDLAQIRLADT